MSLIESNKVRVMPAVRRPFLRRPAVKIALALIVVVVVALAIVAHNLAPMVQKRVVAGLNERFGADLTYDRIDVSLFPRAQVTGDRLVFRQKGRTDVPPLITIQKFTASANPIGLLREHVSRVTLEGLQIQIPPRDHKADHEPHESDKKSSGFVVDEIVADGTVLTMLPRDSWKDPLQFEIESLRLQGAGPSSAMAFQAVLKNAKPPGDIHSNGSFGPWAKDEPGDTPVSGSYTFRNADLSVFKGIAGTLSSDGKYQGVLQEIVVDGTTDVPNFSLNISGNPVDLKTQFHAIVDGTDGSTKLQPVNAQFGRSSVVANGGVESTKGVKGKTVTLDVVANDSRIEDMLRLAAKGKPMMSGSTNFTAKLVIPPGKESVEQKLKLDGGFAIGAAHFSKNDVQQKLNKLSHAGQGEPEMSPDATVASDFGGKFKLDSGRMQLQNLTFRVPGVAVNLAGTYGLADEKIDLRGTARLDAKLSQTVTGVKSAVLKLLDPLFERKKAGAVIPIKIGGTKSSPSVGLAFGK